MSEQEATTRAWTEPTTSQHSVWLTIDVGEVLMQPYSPDGHDAAATTDNDGEMKDLITRLLLHGVRMEPRP
jgi:hypothetical protein